MRLTLSVRQQGAAGKGVPGGRYGSIEREEGDGFPKDGMGSAGAWKRGDADSRKKSLIRRAGKLGNEVDASAKGLVSNATPRTKNHKGNGQSGWGSVRQAVGIAGGKGFLFYIWVADSLRGS